MSFKWLKPLQISNMFFWNSVLVQDFSNLTKIKIMEIAKMLFQMLLQEQFSKTNYIQGIWKSARKIGKSVILVRFGVIFV